MALSSVSVVSNSLRLNGQSCSFIMRIDLKENIDTLEFLEPSLVF